MECLAASLRLRGDAVRVLSGNNEGVESDRAVELIGESRPDLVGISLLYDLQLYDGLKVAQKLKRRHPGIHIVFGGPLASVAADALMSTFTFIDSLVRGEGEEAVVQLASALEQSRPLDDVPGLTWRGPLGLNVNPAGPALDLDTLPQASRDVLGSLRHRNLPITNAYLSTSRGCLAHCTFCTVPRTVRGSNSPYRYRDPVRVVDEMEAVINRFGVRTFYMADDNFLGYGPESRGRLLAFAGELGRRRLGVSYHAECRVDSLDPEVIAALRGTGFDQILLGLESGSDRTLRRWAKGQTVEQNVRAVELARRFKFDLVPSLILLDWESTVGEVAETVAFIERTGIHRCKYPLSLVNKLKVHRGTAAGRRYENTHALGPLPEPRGEANLRRWIAAFTYQDVPIENPYVAEFWRCLSAESNRWSVLSNELVPTLLLRLRRERRADRGLVAACRRWRRALGPSLLGLMRLLIDEVRRRQEEGKNGGDLATLARGWVAAQESAIFPGGIEATLREYHRAPGETLGEESLPAQLELS